MHPMNKPCHTELHKADAAVLPDAHVKLLIEVAVKDAAIPAHIDRVSAHDAVCCRYIEIVYKHLQSSLHVSVRRPCICTVTSQSKDTPYQDILIVRATKKGINHCTVDCKGAPE